MSESDLKYGVSEYLQLGQNQGKWIFLRLNSGEILADYNGVKRKIALCPKGTADFEVITSTRVSGIDYLDVFFLETKSEKGKQTKEQKEFQNLVEKTNCYYYVLRSLSELEGILPLN